MPTIRLRASRQLSLLLCAGHLAAALACLFSGLSVFLKIAVLIAISGSAALALYGPALMRRRGTVVEVELGEDSRVAFRMRGHEWRNGTLLGSSFVTPYLTVLNIRPEENFFARCAVILPDGIDADDFRRLRVWLRWRLRINQS